MNYLKYWKLERTPFQLSGPLVRSNAPEACHTFFDHGTVEEAIARIHFLVQSKRRLGTIAGPSGVGMSRLLRQCCSKPTQTSRSFSECRMHYISVDGWTASHFYRWISNVIGQRTGSKDLYQTALDSILGDLSLPGALVLVIDNTDRANDDLCVAIDELQHRTNMLTTLVAVSTTADSITNLNTEEADSNTNFSRNHRLPTRKSGLARLLGQSQFRIDLPAWGLGQTADYFSMMIESAGGRSAIFEAQAITRIHELANGLIKPMNQIADLSLVAAAARKFARVPSDLVDQVCEELGLISSPSQFEFANSGRFGAPISAANAKY